MNRRAVVHKSLVLDRYRAADQMVACRKITKCIYWCVSKGCHSDCSQRAL